MSPHLRTPFEVESADDLTVVRFGQKVLDELNLQVSGNHLFPLVDRLGKKKVRLDFGKVEFLSSTGLGQMVALNKRIQAQGGHLIIDNVDTAIYELFQITHLNKI